jgi:branched-chain amino acid transport system ATP-binding protein
VPLLQLTNVEVTFMGAIWVLKGVSLYVDEGTIVTLLGGNGTGKSTTLKAISGLLQVEDGRVTKGSIEFRGERIENQRPRDIARKGIIQVMQGRRTLEHLTVDENLRVAAYAYHGGGDGTRLERDLDMVYSYFPALKDLRNRTSGYLSGGEQQMLMVGRGLMSHPKLMLLDEPSLGLSPILIYGIHRMLKRISVEERITMLVVEQNALASLSIADYGYVMEDGRIVFDGPAAKLIENPDLREFYMGLSAVGEKRTSYREVKYYERRRRWLG